VFVYGKQCLDLKSVDYDAIAMLNVSATQELAKKVDALEAENDRLRAQANKLAALESKMETLEKLMSVSHHKRSAASPTLALAH
jgi:cell shape-determining protein MreC